MRKVFILSILTATALSAACLVGETTHTLYLDPTGAVTWIVLEQEIRSDADERGEREAEEADYLDQVHRGEHPIALALLELNPAGSRTRVLRGKRPFTVLTEARFDRLDHLAEDLLRGLGGSGKAALRVEGAETILELTMDLRAGDESEEDSEEILYPLVGDSEDYRIVLTSGRFVDAVGFELQSDDTVAVPLEHEQSELPEQEGDDAMVTLSLRWTAD